MGCFCLPLPYGINYAHTVHSSQKIPGSLSDRPVVGV